VVTLDEAGRGAATARVDAVTGPGAVMVEHAFVLDFRALRRTRWKVLPDTAAHLLLHIDPDGEGLEPRALVLVGARTRAIETDVSARAWTVGVRLRPGALPVLTGLPADDLTDRAARAAELWGRRAADVDERAAEVAADGPQAVRAVLLDFVDELAGRAAAVPWTARALARGVQARSGVRRVRDMADELGIAPRTLRARSRSEVGLAPKRFARIHRLFRALELARGGVSWSEVAARAGFVDQPHLVRDFRALLGESPTRFLSRAAS
jgi:AraC-like DNA-binding protein